VKHTNPPSGWILRLLGFQSSSAPRASPVASDRETQFWEENAPECMSRINSHDFFGPQVQEKMLFRLCIIHDWTDEDCLRILKPNRDIIPSEAEGGRLCIVDSVLDEKSERRPRILHIDRGRCCIDWSDALGAALYGLFVCDTTGLALIYDAESLRFRRDGRWTDHIMFGSLLGWLTRGRPSTRDGAGNSRCHCLKGISRKSLIQV